MATLNDMIGDGTVDGHRPWARALVSAEQWRLACAQLAAGQWTLLGLWGETDAVHMAVLGENGDEIAVISLACPDGTFPSVGALHPPAIRLERAISDLFGLTPAGAPDTRPWLDLGFWAVTRPLSAVIPGPSQRVRPSAGPMTGSARSPESITTTRSMDSGLASSTRPGMTAERLPYPFLPVEGENLHQIPVGPVHAGIIEPGHFRFTANGETVVRLEQRLGYVHKGIESLMAGATLDKAARLAGRTSGDSTVAYALAFAHAAEAALEVQAPPRAVYLRALMAELERLSNHFGDFGAICNDASFSLMHAHCYVLREQILRASDACFGHRLMMDCIVPGGTARDLATGGAGQVLALLREVRRIFPELVELYDNTASLQDRTATTGILRPELAKQFGAGGHVGRASGRAFDVRKSLPYPPYDQLDFRIALREAGDVNARVWVRIEEIEQSLSLIDQILQRLPDGPIRAAVEPAPGRQREGVGLVEGFRGDVLVWLRLDCGRVARCHLRDPSWFQWPLLEAVIEGNIVADFPLCNKSFNCSYSGHDL